MAKNICTACGGSGYYDNDKHPKCSCCKGTGYEEEIEIKLLESYAYCEDCDYETDSMEHDKLLVKLCKEGGYIISDKEDGYDSKCPKCGGSNLTLEH